MIGESDHARAPHRLNPRHDEIHLRLSLLPRHPGFEAANGPDDVILTALQILRRELHRRPHLGLARKLKRGWHHADDRELEGVQSDGSADHARIPSKAPNPDIVSEEDHAAASIPVVLGAEAPAEHRLDAQQRRKVGADARALDALRAIGAVEREGEVLEGRQVTEGGRLFLPVEKVLGGSLEAAEIAAAISPRASRGARARGTEGI